MTLEVLHADWPAPQGVNAATTLRTGGVSAAPYRSLNLGAYVADDPDAVSENRRRLRRACELPSEPVWLRQTHSVNVAIDAPAPAAAGTDALVTRKPGTVCAVLTADCLPLVLAAADGTEVAVAHAGWRGLCAGIVEATVVSMHTLPADIVAWLGPAISQSAFEVGAEVRQQFVAERAAAARHFVNNGSGRFQADLYGLARQRLKATGVSGIFGGQHCTFADSERFFSYRRDGQCGRMATYVYMADGAA